MIIIYRRKRAAPGGLLLPELLAKQGHNNGGEIVAAAAGFGLLFDTNASGTAPDLLDGWTDIVTATFSTVISARLSWKTVSLSESIDPNGSSRANLRIYSNVDTGDPVDDADTTNGTNDCELPALTISSGGRLVVGFVRRAGSGTVPWAAPLGEEIHTQSTSAVSSSAQSLGLLSSFTGMTLDVANNDHVGVVIALNGAAA